MLKPFSRVRRRTVTALLLGAISGALATRSLHATTLRVVSYNIDSYDQGNDSNITSASAGLPSVIQAIGSHHIGTNAQPVDVLGIEELNPGTSNTASDLTAALNSAYGTTRYKFDTTADPTTGGGVDGLIYNSATVQVISAVAVGSVSGSGASRAPLRYQLRPVGYGPAADFYMYVSHMKAGSASTDLSRRGVEAAEIRSDVLNNLGANPHVIFSGDFNATSASSDPSYTTLTASTDAARAYDPTAASTNYVSPWGSAASSAYNYLYSESTSSLNARFDFQLVSNAMLNQAGVQLATDTADPYTGAYPSSKYHYAYEVFGNSGSTPINTVTSASTNTSLSDLPNASAILADMMQPAGSDHLPVVADYSIVGVNPLPAVWVGGTGIWSMASNWSSNSVPNNAGIEVQIDNGSSNASVVTLDINAGISDLILDANDRLNISNGSSLTLNGPASSSVNGALSCAGIISSTGMTVGPTGNLSVTSNGQLNASGSLTNQGIILISGAQNWSSGSLFLNTGGTATINTDAGSKAATLAITNIAGTIALGSTQHLASLNIGSGAIVLVTPAAVTSVLVTSSLSVKGTLDLSTNALDVPGNLAVITSLIRQGYNGGDWAGTGITTSAAASTANHLTALGVIQNNQSGPALFTSSSLFEGVLPGAGDILVKYTWFGDANLDGTVDGSDYSRIDSGYLLQLTGWFNGDFNYDGTIDGSDYTLIDNAFNAQTAQISAQVSITCAIAADATASAVPEPGPIAVWIGAGLITLSRRCRKMQAR